MAAVILFLWYNRRRGKGCLWLNNGKKSEKDCVHRNLIYGFSFICFILNKTKKGLKKMDRTEYAAELHRQGCNCCQAVLLAYQEETGLSEEALMAVGVPFGSGMGRTKGNCGALVGAEMVLGLCTYEGKKMHKDAAALYDAFGEKCGATVCGVLKGLETGVMLCSCEDCIKNGVELVAPFLEK